jgi:hypothetical protein
METLIFCFWPYWKTWISVDNQRSGYCKSCAERSQEMSFIHSQSVPLRHKHFSQIQSYNIYFCVHLFCYLLNGKLMIIPHFCSYFSTFGSVLGVRWLDFQLLVSSLILFYSTENCVLQVLSDVQKFQNCPFHVLLVFPTSFLSFGII